MAQQELEGLTEKMGMVTAYLQQSAKQAAEGVAHSQQQLAQVARGFDAQTRQLSRDAVSEIGRQTRQAIVQGLGEASDECNARLKSTGDSANQAIYHLSQQVAALERNQKSLVWKAGLALVVGALLAVTGLAAYGWHLSQQMEKASFPAALLAAMQANKIVACGDQLCAKVGKTPRKAGANGEYMVLEP